jgi:hypothetical protein
MDSILKIVYDNWYQSIPLSNGLHPILANHIKSSIPSIDSVESTATSLMNSDMFPFRWHNNFFKYFKNHAMVDPDQIVDDADIYIYPIEIRTSLNSLFQDHSFNIGGNSCTYNISDTISPKVLNNLRSGKVKLVINYIHDPVTDEEDIVRFDALLQSIGIDGRHVIIVAGNEFAVSGSSIRVVGGPLLFPREDAERITSRPRPGRLGYMNDYVKQHDLDADKIRPHKFICFNRQLGNRTHRITLAYLALKYNLLNHNVFSFLEKISDEEVFNSINTWKSYYKDVAITEVARKIAQILPCEIDTHALTPSEKTNFSTHNNKKEFYLNTYIHIVSETRFHDGDSPFMSEKTYRPIANFQPFLYVGNYHSLRHLQDLGFKTFHPYINEDYDSEQDPEKRMAMIEQELKKLNDLTIEQIHELYYNVKDILVYNRNHLTTFIDAHPYQNLIRDLQNGI